MNDDPQNLTQPIRHIHAYAHTYSPTYAHVRAHGRPSASVGAPPLRLPGADDDAAVAADPHIVRGID
ncbi:hypothetical protein OG204_35700 (plasmid) [Streptomyces sp. NBC_01387]|uniref:hypothetical protein n=1 Tax=unclassified Streptomyces TaxID=2593676 RepID=UPI002023CAE7|nr:MULTISPECIES: hypothetical protein [unclassified Streptomyces]MCX4554399.1 hypothetical protein [Streptomyces sp. NBC_01500]WSC25221.1 hypothetical protein OIE60_36870 [Streptomyces sp. NBC_01766]WSV58903.1 hypothetical protein OG282_34970 [Streptomyces sp. NBC_01014]